MTGARRTLTLAFAILLASMSHAMAREPVPLLKGSFTSLRSAALGRPLIVHMWGLSCAPCLTELPSWSKFAGDHPEVPFVLINADRPDQQANKRIEQFLAKTGLGQASSYVFADRFEERLRFEIDPDWQGELPRTLLISAAGDTTILAGVADMATVRTWIAAQVK